MREINLAVVHCSATPIKQHVNAAVIRGWHTDKINGRGWSDIGYHFVILREGGLEIGRPLSRAGAHVKGHNDNSVGICLVGGLTENGQPENNFTDAQLTTLRALLAMLQFEHPDIEICGHRDLSPDIDGDGEVEEWEWLKSCPCFNVKAWLKE